MIVVTIRQCILSGTWCDKNCLYIQEGKHGGTKTIRPNYALFFSSFGDVSVCLLLTV